MTAQSFRIRLLEFREEIGGIRALVRDVTAETFTATAHPEERA